MPADATAFAHRGRRIMASVGAIWERPEETSPQKAGVAGLAAALRQGDPDVYVSFVGDEARAGSARPTRGATWKRLAAVKRRYDPTNLFRGNQNIPPAPQGPGR